jgi:hypothetical protein
MAIAQAVTRVGNRKYLDKQFGRQKGTCLCEIDSELIDFLTSAASVFERRQNKREQNPFNSLDRDTTTSSIPSNATFDLDCIKDILERTW